MIYYIIISSLVHTIPSYVNRRKQESGNLLSFFVQKNTRKNTVTNILPSLTLVTIKKALIHFIIWVLEPLYMQENVAIFLLFSSL